MSPADRERFDALLRDAIDALPAAYARVLEEVPVVVEDRPGPELIAELRREGVLPPESASDTSDDDADLCGLHSGVAITERGIEGTGTLPATIHVFREGIVRLACGEAGWAHEHADEEVYEEVRITLLHEMGHHFGLDEGDLEALGYA